MDMQLLLEEVEVDMQLLLEEVEVILCGGIIGGWGGGWIGNNGESILLFFCVIVGGDVGCGA